MFQTEKQSSPVVRKMAPFLFVNTIKWLLIIGPPQIFARFVFKYHFEVHSLDTDFFGLSLFTLGFAFIVGLIESAWEWGKLKK